MFNKKPDNTHTLTKSKFVFKQMQSPNTKWSKFWAGCVLPSYAERWAAGSSPQIRYLLASLHIMPSIIYAYIIYYITSYHPWYITPSLLCTILMHITQFNTIYILSTITQITRSIRMSLYADMCCTFSGGWIDLFVCFCVFVEMHMFYMFTRLHILWWFD